MENGNPRDALVVMLLLIFTILGILWYLVYPWPLSKKWLNGNNNQDNDREYFNKYTYNNKDKKKQYFKGNRQVERGHPPNASFFCRVNGKETFIEGPYEEQFLNRYELVKWKFKKRQEELKKKIRKV